MVKTCSGPESRGWQRRLAVALVAMAAFGPAPLLSQSVAPAASAIVAAPAPAPAPSTVANPRALPDAATRIEAMLARGQTDEALAAARDFLRQVTGRIGFGVTNARLTATPAEGFGMYTPRRDGVYRPGEPVYAYVEVYGFSMTPQPDGTNQMLFDVSFTLDSLDGRQMTDSMIPMGEVRLDSFNQPVDGYFHLTYRVTGAEGSYLLRTEVIDRASGQRAEFRLPVEFVEPGAERDGKQDAPVPSAP